MRLSNFRVTSRSCTSHRSNNVDQGDGSLMMGGRQEPRDAQFSSVNLHKLGRARAPGTILAKIQRRHARHREYDVNSLRELRERRTPNWRHVRIMNARRPVSRQSLKIITARESTAVARTKRERMRLISLVKIIARWFVSRHKCGSNAASKS